MKQLLIIFIWLGLIVNLNAQDIHRHINSAYFTEQREISIHLPKEFDKKEALPVIYLFDAQWKPFYQLTTAIVDYLIEIKTLPRCIVVGVHSAARQYELTPAPVNEDWKMPSLGGAKFLEDHLIKEIIPLVDSLYSPALFRIGIGHSLGGTFVLNSLIDRPKLFNAHIAISPNLQLDEEEIVLKISRNVSQMKQESKFVFTTVGTAGHPDVDFRPAIEKLDTILKSHHSNHFNWHFSIYDNFNHATTPTESIHRGLLELAKKWKTTGKQQEEMASQDDGITAFISYFNELSAWTGYENKPTIYDFYDFGYVLEGKQKVKEAIELYELAIKQYPVQSQLYNKVGENFIKLQNHTKAKEYFQLALKRLETQKEQFEYIDDYHYYKKNYQQNLESTDI